MKRAAERDEGELTAPVAGKCHYTIVVWCHKTRVLIISTFKIPSIHSVANGSLHPIPPFTMQPAGATQAREKKRRKTEVSTAMRKAATTDRFEESMHNDASLHDDSGSDRDATDTMSTGASAAPNKIPIATKRPSGIILRGGRIRLPDKLMEYLNKVVVPDVLYWQTGGLSFSFDSKTAQTELLDKYFSGSKLTSFVRSLNRWGFKRVFHALLPKSVLSYEHPLFKRDSPELVKEMKMAQTHEDPREESPKGSPTVKANAGIGNVVAPQPLGAPGLPSAVLSGSPIIANNTALNLQAPPPSPSLLRSLIASQHANNNGSTLSIAAGVNPQPHLLNLAGLHQASVPQAQVRTVLSSPQPNVTAAGQLDIGSLLQAALLNQQQQAVQQAALAQASSLLQVPNSNLLQAQIQTLLQQPESNPTNPPQQAQAQPQSNNLLLVAQIQSLLHQGQQLNLLHQPTLPTSQQQQQQSASTAMQAQIQTLLQSQQPLSLQATAGNSVLLALQAALIAREQQQRQTSNPYQN